MLDNNPFPLIKSPVGEVNVTSMGGYLRENLPKP
jgi:hypothetical protein